MSRDEAKKLLGGYATGTLTREEEQALFAAALEDQELFDALAREQSLRDLLSDSTVRGQVLAALDDHRQSWWQRATHWKMRPMIAGVAAACLAGVVGYGVWHSGQRSRQAQQMVADNTATEREMAKAAPEAAAPPPASQLAPTASKPAAKPGSQRNDEVRTSTGAGAGGGSGRPTSRKFMAPANNPAPAGPSTIPPAPPVKQPPAETRDAAVDAALKPQTAPLQQAEQSAPQPQQQQVQAAPLMYRANQQQALGTLGGQQASSAVKTAAAENDASSAASRVTVGYLRRETDGSRTHILAQDVHSGDTIFLQLSAPSEGHLTVAKTGQPDEVLIRNQAVDRTQPVEIGPFTLDQPGSIQFTARFVPTAQPRAMPSFGAMGGGGSAKRASIAAAPAQSITLTFQ